MSMLAEARKKVKYSTDPRGANWSKDEDKFGQKLMEKFGWQKGKGLGANEDGRVEHVKASAKNDTKGFGFKKTNNDNWICHQDDFNSLLKNLNASHGRPDQENDEKVISLEEKSKAAKKRVHYHKQTKGKDLSQQSTEDLDCIFGRKKSKIPQEKKEVLPNVEETKDAPDENTHGIQTIQSSQSVQEYFAMKLSQMKAKKRESLLAEVSQKEKIEDEPAEVPAPEETYVADPKIQGSDEEMRENVNSEKSRKKKKKSKDKEKHANKEHEESCFNSSLERVEKENVDAFNSERNEAGENCDENTFFKKSKKKKKTKEDLDNVSEVVEIAETVMDELPVAADNKLEAAESNSVVKPKKKKRDKKCKDGPSTNVVNGESLENSLSCNRDISNSTNSEPSDRAFITVTKEAPVSVEEGIVIVEKEIETKPKKHKKKRTKDEVEIVSKTTTESDILDKSVSFDVDNSNNVSHLADDNNEETIASPPKKKKKKKSSKKSKYEAEENSDALPTKNSVGDNTQAQKSSPSEMRESKQSSTSIVVNYDDLNAFSSSLSSFSYIPKNKHQIKRNPSAVNTATKKFQDAGANVDKICGYGYNMQ